MVSKGYPMELGDKGNDEIGQWRQEYKPKPIFPPNLPTNPCPKVPMKSKENYSTIPMKNHTLGQKACLQKYIHDKWLRDHMVASGGRQNGTLSYLVAARGC